MDESPSAAKQSRTLRFGSRLTPFFGWCLLASSTVGISAALQGMPDPDHYRIYAEKYADAFFRWGELPDAFRSPLYPLLLVRIVHLAQDPTPWIALFHASLSVAILAAVWRIARRLSSGTLLPTVACLLTAIDPILVFQSGQIMTETLFTALMLWSISAWLDDDAPSPPTAAFSGLLAGLAFLTRPAMAPIFAAVGLAVALLARWKTLRRWLTAAMLAFAVSLPWALLNKQVLGQLIFTTVHGGYTLWLANNPSFYEVEVAGERDWSRSQEFDQWQAANQREAPVWRVDKDSFFKDAALRWIRENPNAAVQAALYRLSMFWGIQPRTGPSLLRPIIGVYFGVLFTFAIVGWFVTKSCRGPGLVATLVVIALSLVHTIYWSNMRFRAPIEPLLAIWAAAAVDWLWRFRKSAT